MTATASQSLWQNTAVGAFRRIDVFNQLVELVVEILNQRKAELFHLLFVSGCALDKTAMPLLIGHVRDTTMPARTQVVDRIAPGCCFVRVDVTARSPAAFAHDRCNREISRDGVGQFNIAGRRDNHRAVNAP